MNTIDLKKPDPTVEEDGCGFYACRVIADDVDVEERDPATEATQLDQIEPEEDFDEWLARKGPDDPPEPEDEDISLRESNELFIWGIRAFARPVSAARGKAAIRRTRQLRVLQARQASRRLAIGRTRHGRLQARPRGRSGRAASSRRAQSCSRAGDEPGPHARPEPVTATGRARRWFTPDEARRLGAAPAWRTAHCGVTNGPVRGWS